MMMDISDGKVSELLQFPELKMTGIIGWTPDAKHVLFSRWEKKGISLWRISLEGGDSKRLWESEKKLSGLSLHPGGQQIAFHILEMEHEIWMMENFLPKTR